MPTMGRRARSLSVACDRASWLAPVRTIAAAGAFFLGMRLRLEPGKILGHRTLLTLRVGPVQFIRRFAMIAAGVGLHHARIHREAFALHEARDHASCNHALENMAQDLALTEAAQPLRGERRRLRSLVVEIELAEPAVSKVQGHFLAQPALMTNAIAVADQEHTDHQFGIDRGPADVAVKRL